VLREYKVDKRVGEKTKYIKYGRNLKGLDGLSSDRTLENEPNGGKKILRNP
jgi:hypothetical protein